MPINIDYRINLERAKRENLYLESKVRERTKEIGDILDNIGESILTVSEDLIVNPEYSRISEVIFERRPAGVPLAKLLYQDEKNEKGFEGWAKLIFAENRAIDISSVIEIAEKEIEIKLLNNTRSLKMEYQPILEENSQKVKKLMLVITDITRQKELEVGREL